MLRRPTHDHNHAWGQGIVVGARVTSLGRHGTGQPAIGGVVERVDGDTATVRIDGFRAAGQVRRRSIRNLRVV